VLVIAQIALGGATVLTGKAVLATAAHVSLGATVLGSCCLLDARSLAVAAAAPPPLSLRGVRGAPARTRSAPLRIERQHPLVVSRVARIDPARPDCRLCVRGRRAVRQAAVVETDRAGGRLLAGGATGRLHDHPPAPLQHGPCGVRARPSTRHPRRGSWLSRRFFRHDAGLK
jgi:hypothetical protein